MTIKHGNTIKKAKEYIDDLPVRIKDYIKDSIDDYKNIGKLTKFEDLQKRLLDKLQKSTTDEVRKYNKSFENILKGRVNSLVELLDKLGKLQQIIDKEDIKAIDFLREKIFNSIINRK